MSDERIRDLERRVAKGEAPESELLRALSRAGLPCGRCPDRPHTPDEIERTHRVARHGRPVRRVRGCRHDDTFYESFDRSTASSIFERMERCARCGVVLGSCWIPSKNATSNAVQVHGTNADAMLHAARQRSERALRARFTRRERAIYEQAEQARAAVDRAAESAQPLLD